MLNPSYNLNAWANRLPELEVFGIDWAGPEGFGRIEIIMPCESGCPILHTEGMSKSFVKKLLNQLVDDSIVEE